MTTTRVDGSPSQTPPAHTLDELAERLRKAESGGGDAAQVSLEDQWKRLAGGALIVLVCVWLGTKIREGRATALGEASQRFASAQDAFSKILFELPGNSADAAEDAAKKNEELRKNQVRAFDDAVTSLQNAGSSGSYPELGKLYAASLAIAEGKADAALTNLQGLRAAAPYKSDKPAVVKRLTADELVGELTSLVYLRAEIEKSGALTADLRKAAKQLALGSQVVGGEALLILARFSETPEERRDVADTAKAIFAVRPGLEKVVGTDLERLGIELNRLPSNVNPN